MIDTYSINKIPQFYNTKTFNNISSTTIRPLLFNGLGMDYRGPFILPMITITTIVSTTTVATHVERERRGRGEESG